MDENLTDLKANEAFLKHVPTENYIKIVLPIVLSDCPPDMKRNLVKQAIKSYILSS